MGVKMKELRTIENEIIEIDQDGQIWYEDGEQMTTRYFLKLFIPEKLSSFKLTNEQAIFDLLNKNYFQLKNWIEESFALGFNPMPQLRKKYYSYKWEFQYHPHFLVDNINDDEFRIVKVGDEVQILPPKNFKQYLKEGIKEEYLQDIIKSL